MNANNSPSRLQYVVMLILFVVWSAMVVKIFEFPQEDEYSNINFIASLAWVGGLYFIASRVLHDQW